MSEISYFVTALMKPSYSRARLNEGSRDHKEELGIVTEIVQELGKSHFTRVVLNLGCILESPGEG